MIQLLIVNYHYIREQAHKNGIHAVTPALFSRQLDLVAEHGYTFISLSELISSIDSNISVLPRKCCLITFDDGFKEAYDVGLSILDQKGIPAAFFVITDCIINKKLSKVHQLHFLRGQYADEYIIKFVDKKVKWDKIDLGLVKKQYPFDNIETGRMKFALNFGEDNIIEDLFHDTCDEHIVAENLFMNESQVQILSRRNYLGSHSNSHKPLAMLSTEQMANDIKMSVDSIHGITGSFVSSISYPFGETIAIDKRVPLLSKSLGLRVGFTMVRKINEEKDILDSPLMLGRFDTNDVFGGGNYEQFSSVL